MTDLDAHVRELADGLDVAVWICANCEGDPNGEAQVQEDGQRVVILRQPPGSSNEAYLVALHELGHHAAHPWDGRHPKLDYEVAAWRWALDESKIRLREPEYRLVWRRLKDYGRDRRFKQTDVYKLFLGDVAEKIAPRHDAPPY